MRLDEVNEPVRVVPGEPIVANPLNRSEVNDIVTNGFSSLHGRIMKTVGVLCGDDHRYGHFLDLSEVNLGHMPLTLLPVGSVLLETIRVIGVL